TARIHDGPLTDIAEGTDDNIWAATGTNTLLTIAPNGATTIHLIPSPPLGQAASYHICASSIDNSMWFTGSGSYGHTYIGHMTISGQVSWVALSTTRQ